MMEGFDPYHKWLGISPKDQPPNHYKLLGVDLFEADLDVIDNAADQRMTHVKRFAAGRHGALSQQLLNEISFARVCLMDREKKREYDEHLSVVSNEPPRTATVAPPPSPNGAHPIDELLPPTAPTSHGAPQPNGALPAAADTSAAKVVVRDRRRRNRPRNRWIVPVLLVTCTGLMLAVLLAILFSNESLIDRLLDLLNDPG